MKHRGSAYTPDYFHPMLVKELNLLSDFAWQLIHDLNGSSKTIRIVKDPDYIGIREHLKNSEQSNVYVYRKHPHINEIYMHSAYQKWNLVKLVQTKNGKYKYEILFIN